MRDDDKLAQNFRAATSDLREAPIRWERVARLSRRRRLAAAASVIAAAIVLTVLLAGGVLAGKEAVDTSFTSAVPLPSVVTPSEETSALQRRDVLQLLERYQSAWSSHSSRAMAALLSSSFQRRNDQGVERRAAALAEYRCQFRRYKHLRYAFLPRADITIRGKLALVQATYRLSPGGTTGHFTASVAREHANTLFRQVTVPGVNCR
jgi:hypothetical protein